jgi:hypothetical protein
MITDAQFFDQRHKDHPIYGEGIFYQLIEKYGTLYLDASNWEVLKLGVIKILKERFESGHYFSKEELPNPPFTEKELDNIPDALRNSANKQMEMYKRRVKRVISENDFYDRAKYAVENEDGKAAFLVLVDRSHYQYEGFERLTFEKVG